MKKIIAIALILLNVIMLVSCTQGNAAQTPSSDSQSNEDIEQITYAETDTVEIKGAKGSFSKNTKVNVEYVLEGRLYDVAAKSLSDISEKFVVYDISAREDNVTVQPIGKIEAQFEIPQEFNIYMTNVVYIADDGQIEYIQSEIDESSRTITATLSHFSTYAVINVKSVQAQLKYYITVTHKPGKPGGDCYDFVDMLCQDIFKHNLYGIKAVYGNNGKMELVTTNKNKVYFTQIGDTLSYRKNNITEENLHSLFLKAKPGDIVQMDYTRYKPKKGDWDSLHTMMVYDVSDTGVWLYHRGTSGRYFGRGSESQPLWGVNKNLDCQPVTWADLADILTSEDDGISIFRSTRVGCIDGHKFSKATCTEPKTCIDCGYVSGESLGHDTSKATCTKGATCSRCSATISALGHSYSSATCVTPSTCTRCKLTRGSALGHDFSGVSCTKGGSCKRCSAMKNALGHKFSNGLCTVCGADDPTCSIIVPANLSGEFEAITTSSSQTLNNDDLSVFVLKISSNSGTNEFNGQVTYTGYQLAEKHYNTYFKNQYSTYNEFLKNTPDKRFYGNQYYVPTIGDGDIITDYESTTQNISFDCSLLSYKTVKMSYMREGSSERLTVVSGDSNIKGLVFKKITTALT
ncbi:MAG: hypothetical protein J6B93_00235 [Clostridia bacterium]|nr:hypothetical protein [Clostridia bacterium]